MRTHLLHVVCPHCDTVNRVPQERLAETPNCGRCHHGLFTGHPLALDERRFNAHVERSDIPVIVDFWAPWCAPCRSMAPDYERAAAKLEPQLRLAKVDTQAHPSLAARYGIRSIPTLIAFRDGHEIARHSGALPATALLQWMGQHTRHG